jgi:hypothetical protein
MKTRLTLRPGDNGTKKLQLKYGGRLVAVRFRYDPQRRLRFKTVELIEEQLPWVPTLPASADPSMLVLVRVGFEEAELRQAVKLAGGRWQQERKLWQLSLASAYHLGLDARICGVTSPVYIQRTVAAEKLIHEETNWRPYMLDSAV